MTTEHTMTIAEAKEEMARLARKIAAMQGVNCAIALITPSAEGYEDVCPELIVEDALRVSDLGWPSSFSVDLLNPSN